MLLCELKENETAKITAVDDSSPLYRRLCDMGFLPGQSVRCANIALCGSPIAYVVMGTKIALRKTEAARIGVVL